MKKYIDSSIIIAALTAASVAVCGIGLHMQNLTMLVAGLLMMILMIGAACLVDFNK